MTEKAVEAQVLHVKVRELTNRVCERRAEGAQRREDSLARFRLPTVANVDTAHGLTGPRGDSGVEGQLVRDCACILAHEAENAAQVTLRVGEHAAQDLRQRMEAVRKG